MQYTLEANGEESGNREGLSQGFRETGGATQEGI